MLGRLHSSASTAGQLFFEVWVMKGASCAVTFVLLHVGQLTLLFSRSEMVMVSSNGFRHFSQMNAYLGMAVTYPVRHVARVAFF